MARMFLASVFVAVAVVSAAPLEGRAGDMPFAVVAAGDGFTNRLSHTESGWSDGVVSVSIDGNGRVQVRSPVKRLSTVTLSWEKEWPCGALFLNDAWERSYGELGWQSLSDDGIVSPWYFLESADGKTCGVGVETQPSAMACWKVGKGGFSLVLDVRAGGRPVRLGERALSACRIVHAESTQGESAWQFGRRFCRMMCPNPRLPKSPVYGYNDWYCAYGKNTATNFLADAEYVMSCAKGCETPPYVVMDDGWQRNSPPVVHESGRGPWDAAGPNFGMDMPEFCRRIAALGAKPGLWYRPLRAWDELPEEERLMAARDFLDPTVPSVRARIVEDMRRFREWGFKLVKIDYLAFDIAQTWSCDPHPYPELFIQDDRAWRDDSRTTAEVMLDLYRAMKDAVGDEVVIIGCNALNHLVAGVFELQRTGNDTSGRDWKWTRKNGVNTLAMRSIQDGAFFKVDADCVGLASEGAVPWRLNRQWMELLGRSGTPMFVSWRRELATPEVRKALADSFRLASSVRDTVEPVDWLGTRLPRSWRCADGMVEYNWWRSVPPREAGLFKCQVHRGGGASTRPDNALETFLWCWGHGVAPEADARLTKDGVAIAFHDPTLKRIARGIPRELQDREIKCMTWDEIKDVDVGSYMGEEYSSTRIATIESVFAAMKGRPERLLYLDEKGAPPALVAELAGKFGVVEQVYYTSPVWQRITEWNKIAPKGRSMVWLGAWAKNNSPEETARCEEFVQKRLDEMVAVGFEGIDQVQLHIRTDLSNKDPFCPSTPFLNRAISLLHSYGVLVQAITWTEGDNPNVYRMLWDVGFDTFATDYPYALFGFISRFGNCGR